MLQVLDLALALHVLIRRHFMHILGCKYHPKFFLEVYPGCWMYGTTEAANILKDGSKRQLRRRL